jgi:pimeloyl-ACP methyl ester carboxylesterase
VNTYVRVAGRDVHYVEHGEGARTLVALHGFPVDHRITTGWLEPCFAGRDGWRRVYLDLPGMGLTSGDGIGSTDEVFDVVRQAVDELAPGSFALAGSSYGGYLARGLVAAEGDRVTGLALSVPMVVAAHADRDVPPYRLLHQQSGVDLPEGSEDFSVVVSAATVEATKVQVDPGLAAADPDAIERISASYAGTFALRGAQPFDRPSLILTGRQDNITGYRDQWSVLEDFPRATFAVLDRAGHNVTIEQPELVAALTTEWLDRVEEGTA